MIDHIGPTRPPTAIPSVTGGSGAQDPNLLAYELLAELYLLEKSPNANDADMQDQINQIKSQLQALVSTGTITDPIASADVTGGLENLAEGTYTSWYENPTSNPVFDAFDYLSKINLNPNNLDPAEGFGLMMLFEAAYTNPYTNKYQGAMEALLQQGSFGSGADFLSKFFLEEGAKLGFSPQIILNMMHQPTSASNDGPNYTAFYTELSGLVGANPPWTPSSPYELGGDWMALQAYIDNSLGVSAPSGPASPQAPVSQTIVAAAAQGAGGAAQIAAEIQQLMQLIEDLTNNKPGAEQNLITFLQTLMQNGDINNPSIAALLGNLNVQQAVYQAYMHGAETAYFNGYDGKIGEAAYLAYINDQQQQLQKLGISGPIADDMNQALASIQAEADDYNTSHSFTSGTPPTTTYTYTYTNSDGSQLIYECNTGTNPPTYSSEYIDASGNIVQLAPPTASDFQGFINSHIPISGIATSNGSYWSTVNATTFAQACLQQMTDNYGSFNSYFIQFMLAYYGMEEGSQSGYQSQLDQITGLLQDISTITALINSGATITPAQAAQLGKDMADLKTLIDSSGFLTSDQKATFEKAINDDFLNMSVTVPPGPNGVTKTLEQWLQADPTGGELATALQTAMQTPGGLNQILAGLQQIQGLSQEQNIVMNQLQLVIDMMKTILSVLKQQNTNNNQLIQLTQQIPK